MISERRIILNEFAARIINEINCREKAGKAISGQELKAVINKIREQMEME